MFPTAFTRRVLPLVLLVPSLLGSACVSHEHATEFHGLDGVRGVPVEYQMTSVWSLNVLFTWPIWGDASKTQAISHFNAEAAARGADRVRITETTRLTWWFILPPLSFIIHPVHATVSGDIETDALPGG